MRQKTNICSANRRMADPGGRVGLQPLSCWGCGFESRRWHGWPSLIFVVYCQVEVSTML